MSAKGGAENTIPRAPPSHPEAAFIKQPMKTWRKGAAQVALGRMKAACSLRAAHHKGVPGLLSGSDSFRHQVPPVRQEG